MPIEVVNKINNLINKLDTDSKVTTIKTLKKQMDQDVHIKKLIDNFNNAKDIYERDKIISDSFIKAKEELYNNPIVSEYRKLTEDLQFLILYFNQKLAALTSTKQCEK